MNLSDGVILQIKKLKLGAVFPIGVLAINADLLNPSFGVRPRNLHFSKYPKSPLYTFSFLICLKTHSQELVEFSPPVSDVSSQKCCYYVGETALHLICFLNFSLSSFTQGRTLYIYKYCTYILSSYTQQTL